MIVSEVFASVDGGMRVGDTEIEYHDLIVFGYKRYQVSEQL